MKFTDALDEYLDACAEVQRFIDREGYNEPGWGYALDRKRAAADALNCLVPGLSP